MKFKITIDCNNSAFHANNPENNEHAMAAELSRCLHEVTKKLKNHASIGSFSGRTEGAIMDMNGSKVGKWTLEDD